LTFGILLALCIHFFTCLTCTHRRHARGCGGITGKYRSYEASRSTR